MRKKGNGRKGMYQDPNVILSKKLRMGLDTFRHNRNLNKLVVGGTGAMKTRGLVIPNLMQCNTSFVVTDPAGEAYRACGGLLEQSGYIVRCFNLADMERSHRFNPLLYLRKPEDIKKLAQSFVDNTEEQNRAGGEQIWSDGMKMLMEALIALLCETAPEGCRTFERLTELSALGKLTSDNMGAVSDLDKLFEEYGAQHPESLAWKTFQLFAQSPPKTRASMAANLNSRLAVFHIPAVAALTGGDELALDQTGDRKTALFCIIPENDRTFNFLAGLLYMTLFQTLYHRAKTRKDGMTGLDVHVQVIMDEFRHVALPRDFESILSTCRKYRISIDILLQNMTQLKELYEKSWESVAGNCDTMIYLGGNEEFSWRFFSEAMGKATINAQTAGRSGQNLNSSQQLLGRELMTRDEVRMLDNRKCLVLIRGEQPVMDGKYNLKRHPNYRKTLPGGAPPFSQEFTHEPPDVARVLGGLAYQNQYGGSGSIPMEDIEDDED